jgi:CSLREA domain-containing protein
MRQIHKGSWPMIDDTVLRHLDQIELKGAAKPPAPRGGSPTGSTLWGASRIALLLLLLPAALSAQIVVDTTTDELNGGATSGSCSLREAIANANSDSGAQADCGAGVGSDVITLPAGTYTLTRGGTLENGNATGDLDVTDGDGLTINGAGSATTIIQAGTTTTNGIDRVIDVFGDLTLNGVTVRHGRLNFADAGSAFGAGINILDATVMITDSVITLNNVLDTGSCSNSCGAGGIGNTNGTLTLTNSVVSSNTAFEFGGGICTGDFNLGSGAGSVTLDNSTLSGNSAPLGGGMEISSLNLGTPIINIVESTVSGNSATMLQGGGIINTGGTLTILSSDVTGNTATAGVGDGGGIANITGTLDVVNSTISGNSAADEGGGLYAANLRIRSSTIAGNSAVNAGGGLTALGLTAADVQNSIFTGNSATSDDDCFQDPAAINGSNNLVDDFASGGCSGTSTAAVTNFDPTLANNGGPTLTHALLAGSNAIDTGAGGCPDHNDTPLPRDQRLFLRGNGVGQGGAQCDIGAFEFDSAVPVELMRFSVE